MEKKNYHEINRYRDKLFPVEIYQVDETGIYPLGRGIRDFHWHEELQFTFAVKGSLTLQVDARQYYLQEGEAAFINSGMIHAVTNLSEGGRYASLNFPYKMLSFFPGSRMDREYVLPYVTGGVPVVLLHAETEWQKDSLNILQNIFSLWDNATGNEYLISLRIATLWSLLLPYLSAGNRVASSIDLVRRERLQSMLSFIYDHFPEEITIGDIADAAHISSSECNRIFREHLQSTPYQFLTEYRVRKSIELLSVELSVSEIAGYCGYNQTSNYIAKFKAIMNCTPAQYRRHMKTEHISSQGQGGVT